MAKHFGILEDMVSNKDSWFIRRFWIELFKILGITLKFSTTNHPQIDRQIGRVNMMLKEYLRYYVMTTQPNWLELIDVSSSVTICIKVLQLG